MKKIKDNLTNPVAILFAGIVLSIPAFINSFVVGAESWSDLSWWGFASGMAIPAMILYFLFLLIRSWIRR